MNNLYKYFPITSTGAPPAPPPGGSVTSLNSLTGALTLVAGTNITITPLGTNITIDAASGSITIGTANGLSLAGTVLSLALSSTSTTGALSSTDWNTFNNKQSTLTLGNLTDAGTDGIVITGGTGAVVGSGTSIAQHVSDSTHNGYLSSTDWSTFNNKQSALVFGNLTDVGTDGITVTSGTGAVIGSGTSIAQQVSDASHNGYLSSADWSTFNSKQAALTPGNISTSTTGVTVGSGTASTVGPNVTINVQTASGSQPGLLSAADWTTFNNKQTAGNYITALTGDVTASGPGSVAATIANLAVTNAKIANTTIDLTTKVTGALPIANGGTGQITKAPAFDALSPMSAGGDLIYGGASGTGTRLPNGTTGQILTSGGGTAAPTWVTTELPSVLGPSTLRNFYAMNEDFNTGALAGSYGWTSTVATGTIAMNTANLDSTHWGIVALTSGTASGNAALLSLNTALRSIVLGSAVNLYIEMAINLSRLSASGTDDYLFRVGLIDNWTGLPNNGVWFDYSTVLNSSSNWFRSTANAGARTQTNSTVAVATGWLKLAIKITGVTSAEFFVNDVSIGTNSTNLPTGAVYPGIGISKSANGTTNTTALIDYFSVYANWPSGR